MKKIGNMYVNDSLYNLLTEDEYDDFANWMQKQGGFALKSDASGSDLDSQIVQRYRSSKNAQKSKWNDFRGDFS